jgi:hypothetical protein
MWRHWRMHPHAPRTDEANQFGRSPGTGFLPCSVAHFESASGAVHKLVHWRTACATCAKQRGTALRRLAKMSGGLRCRNLPCLFQVISGSGTLSRKSNGKLRWRAATGSPESR